MSFDVAPQQDLYTKQGVAVTVEAVAQIKVKSDPASIQTAAEQFLTKTPPQREGLIRLVMEGHLRGIIGQLTVEEIVKQPEMVADRMRSTCAEDMTKMGLEVVSFTIKEVRTRTSTSRTWDVPTSRASSVTPTSRRPRRSATRRSSAPQAQREAAIAQAQADQAARRSGDGVAARSRPRRTRDLEMKKAQYAETIKRQQAQADKAYEIQTNVMQQQVVAEPVRVQQIEKQEQVKVQEAEILRREKELIATVLKQARDRAAAHRDARRRRAAAPHLRGRRSRRRDARAG